LTDLASGVQREHEALPLFPNMQVTSQGGAMKGNRYSNRPKRILHILAVGTILAAGTLADAQPGSTVVSDSHKRCSSRTLQGAYGFQIEGTILGPNLTLRTLVLAQFDGIGQISEVDHVVLNGTPPEEDWRPSTGTYIVNADCTGSASIEVAAGNPPLAYHFIIVEGGRKILLVVDGGAINGVAYKVD
jgi:hypothetical protein